MMTIEQLTEGQHDEEDEDDAEIEMVVEAPPLSNREESVASSQPVQRAQSSTRRSGSVPLTAYGRVMEAGEDVNPSQLPEIQEEEEEMKEFVEDAAANATGVAASSGGDPTVYAPAPSDAEEERESALSAMPVNAVPLFAPASPQRRGERPASASPRSLSPEEVAASHFSQPRFFEPRSRISHTHSERSFGVSPFSSAPQYAGSDNMQSAEQVASQAAAEEEGDDEDMGDENYQPGYNEVEELADQVASHSQRSHGGGQIRVGQSWELTGPAHFSQAGPSRFAPSAFNQGSKQMPRLSMENLERFNASGSQTRSTLPNDRGVGVPYGGVLFQQPNAAEKRDEDGDTEVMSDGEQPDAAETASA